MRLHGQELNPESYAICLADMLVKGQDVSHIVLGNSLSADGHAGERFHYRIANPPFGVDWSKVEDPVCDEHETRGESGRFGDKQGTLLRALLDDEDFRARAGELIMSSIYDALSEATS